MNIEFVCTGNQCRSPMAEAFARNGLAERGLDVTVSSSGVHPPGSPAAREVIDLMAERGLDLTAHRSRTFDAAVIAAADLVIGMERHHLTELVAITPDAYARCFTLPEFVHRVESLDLESLDRPALDEIIALIAETRGRRDLLRVGVADEIPDPMGRSSKIFDRTADVIDDLVNRLLDAVWAVPDAIPTGMA